MAKLIIRFPDGAPGIAALLMRCSCALMAFPALAGILPPETHGWLVAVPAALMAFGFVAGFGTRVSALLLVGTLVADLSFVSGEAIPLRLAAAVAAVALAFLGPGAFSVDAHRYGRRVIRLEPRSPDRGGSG
ncbi:hypothetical protein [Sphingomonas sanxanigenens]|uniref:Uncharacterized protein n=1 Tax=Sphingomonas sanxanigenens DSM 19645 = NX02 TaxID=1123269 RepID=W0ACE5_9SPHN|nr:hypothetical protein [Sphingomonas sanxanigenens]AHE54212.1 hypothetical protein NX02_12570 [Sphingomonas sanxanigenens DSM 19645 = NX02]